MKYSQRQDVSMYGCFNPNAKKRKAIFLHAINMFLHVTLALHLPQLLPLFTKQENSLICLRIYLYAEQVGLLFSRCSTNFNATIT